MDKKNRTLYMECYSGISGDMTVAALLDLGADEQALLQALKSLPVGGFEIKISRVKKAGLDVCDFHVMLDKEHENHDHDMEYLHGHSHGDGHMHEYGRSHGEGCMHEHSHDHGDGHMHEHGHSHEEEHVHEHGHVHEHRGLPEIIHIIEHASLTDRAKGIAIGIFKILAEAEAKAHGVPKEQVHFHEVGAVDSIVDIAAAAFCLDNLDITEVIVPKLYEGRGCIRCQHGIIPVPAPAVVNIAEAHGLSLHLTDVEGELVTPTGAAIVAAIRTSDRLPERFSIVKTGMGAGKRNYDRPGILRAMLIDTDTGDDVQKDEICKLETNIDDCSGESLGYTMERLLEAGARDVHYVPVYMKKNRPAYQLSVICSPEDTERMERIIFEETTTIGIRRTFMERSVLKRENRSVQTPLGEAQVKVCRLHGREEFFPEYDSVIALCREHGKNYQEVYHLIQQVCRNGNAF